MRDRTMHAFTLVEALVAIGVIGILVSLAVPALQGAKRAAGETASLSNLAQIGRTFEGWLGANDGVYPVALPGVTYWVTIDGRVGMAHGSRWESVLMWPAVMRDFAPWNAHIHTWVSPGSHEAHNAIEHKSHFFTSYSYCHSFVASPTLWTAEGAADAPINPRRYEQSVRSSQVAFPAGKAMHYDRELAYDRRRQRGEAGFPDKPSPILFADGHAAVHRSRDAATPVRNVLNPGTLRDAPLHNTPDGVSGRDY